MKLTKKQLSASYVIKATAAIVGIHTGDVANHGNSRFDRCPMANPEGKVEPIPQVSFRKTSRERVWSPYQASNPVHTPTGLEKHSQLKERHPSCNVEEGPQSVMYRDTCYGNGKAGWQWRRRVKQYHRRMSVSRS
jgi:hypothetical protein